MKVTLKLSDCPPFDLFTRNEEKAIIQNILAILKTANGSCPGLRDYGIDPDILHKPVPVAKAAYSVSITKQMAEYVPEATLVSLEFEDDPKHPEILNPILEVTIP